MFNFLLFCFVFQGETSIESIAARLMGKDGHPGQHDYFVVPRVSIVKASDYIKKNNTSFKVDDVDGTNSTANGAGAEDGDDVLDPISPDTSDDENEEKKSEDEDKENSNRKNSTTDPPAVNINAKENLDAATTLPAGAGGGKNLPPGNSKKRKSTSNVEVNQNTRGEKSCRTTRATSNSVRCL
jgi:hypothetical protein